MKSSKNFVFTLLAGLIIISSSFQTAEGASKTRTVKNLYFTLTYPSEVKIPKGDCGTFKVTYKVGISAKQAYYGKVNAAVLVDADVAAGISWYLDLNNETTRYASTKLKDSGTADWKFCKVDWIDEFERARIGITPGTYKIGFTTQFGESQTVKTAPIRFIK